MSDPIKDVIKALDNIDKRFYQIPDVGYLDDELVDNGKFKKLERRFMNEFSIQFSLIHKDNQAYQKLDYDFEIPKKFMWYENPDLDIRNTWGRLNRQLKQVDMLESFTTIPDFIVHACQRDKNPENQRLIIEAKVNPNTNRDEIFKDIFHTFIYSNKYDFQYSILLLVNTDKEKWIDYFNQYLIENFYVGSDSKFKKIFTIFKYSYDTPSEVYSIDEITKNFISKRMIVCPKCGADLVKKQAMRGATPGQLFLGCSKFPDCRGSKDLSILANV